MDIDRRETKAGTVGATTAAETHAASCNTVSRREDAAEADARLKSEAWRRENKAAIEAFNRFIEREGIPLSRHRQF